jgi:EAL domain-containing protein (putative c-di-GMP-specific phosphodiesterase class I)/ActR/RegA family two-component response regulator
MSEKRPQPRREHAFVVDDEAQVRSFVAEALISAGYAAHQLSTSIELDAAMIQWPPSVIVLDLSLGNSDAVEILRNLSASRFRGDVLLITGRDEATLKEVQAIGERRRLSMLQPLMKPFRLEALRERLRGAHHREMLPSGGVNLEAALKNKWLELWYQPKIDLRSMMVCGAEALVRLRHPVHGVVPPDQFLPRPRDPLYHPLTDYVVRRSLADWLTFADHRMTNRLAINVPASVLQRPGFVANLRDHLPKHPKFPGLIVEITEDEAISDPELAREIAVQLKLYDIYVSIDDFGAGYSSLERLSELPFAEIKLDRSYVQGCSSDKRRREMCQVVKDLAKRFGIVAVAEGVEEKDDLAVLLEIGYDVAQGFLFAKPMPSADFVQLIEARAAV